MGIGAPKDLTACRRFFAEPSHPRQRQYEALRAFFFEGRPSHEVARDFGYSAGSFRVLCHAFRRDLDPQFFTSPAPGPRTQPQKSKAHDLVIALRKQNHSVYEIAELLEERKMPLSPTAVRELLRARVSRRCPGARHRPRYPLCDHARGLLQICLEVVRFPMRLERGFVPVNLIEEQVVRVVLQHEHIELKAAGLLDCLGGVFCNGFKELVPFRRHDVEINGIDIDGIFLRHGVLARISDTDRRQN